MKRETRNAKRETGPRVRWIVAIVVVALSADAVRAAEGVGVTVREEAVTLKVSPPTRKVPKFPLIEKLKGKSEYTTKALVLENEKLALTILPEFGGRITHVVYKPTKKECFWVNDEIVDDVSWSLGGMRVSFPFWEHGRHFDETAGYATVKGEDGSITVAMDMRFGEFLKMPETTRYGRATALRLGQAVTLRPGESKFDWRVTVDNPMVLPSGFKLWTLFRQPNTRGIEVILPTGWTTGHGATALEAWDPKTVVGEAQFSKFAVGMQEDFSGWYLPGDDLNVIVVRDHKVAPGCKQVLYPAAKEGEAKSNRYVEMWIGSHEVFEEPGRLLPALSAYEMALTVQVMQGKGKAVYADRTGVYGAEEAGKKGLAVKIGAKPEKEFALVQQRVAGKMPGGEGLYAEGMDLVTETQMNLVRYAPKAEQILKTSDDPVELLPAARRLMRVRKDSPEVLAGLDKVLAKEPKNDWARLYKAIWLLEAGKPAEADKLLSIEMPREAAYLIALRDISRGEPKRAAASVEFSGRLAWSLPGQAETLMQSPGITSGTAHALLKAMLPTPRQATQPLAEPVPIPQEHPDLLEAWLLAGDAERVRTMTENNASGKKGAEENVANLKAGKWAGIPRVAK